MERKLSGTGRGVGLCVVLASAIGGATWGLLLRWLSGRGGLYGRWIDGTHLEREGLACLWFCCLMGGGGSECS